jgi:hypothetical protein
MAYFGKKSIEMDDGRLVCPRCADPYGMHHEKIDIGSRPVEDGPGRRFIVHPNASLETRDVSENTTSAGMGYHGRRDELIVEFSCESCGPVGRMLIMQHKGSTFIEWLILEERS